MDVGGTINSFNMIISDPHQKKSFYDIRMEVIEKRSITDRRL